MKKIKVAAVALNQTPMDWVRNISNIKTAIHKAANDGAKIICLPELCITGYGCEDTFHSKDLLKRSMDALHSIKKETKGIIVSVGLPVEYNGALFNTSCLLFNGAIEGFVCKKHLAGDGIHYEPRWFHPWPDNLTAKIDDAYPIGDIYFEVDGIKIGMEICEDAWVSNRPGASLAARGVDIILNPSASHFAFGKHEVRRRFVLEGSRAYNCVYVYSNLLGNESGRVIFDGDTFIASEGRVFAEGKRFSYNSNEITSAVVDIDANKTNRIRTASFTPDLTPDKSRRTFYLPIDVKLETTEHITDQDADITSWSKFQEFDGAVCLGLWDFLRKSGMKGYTLSLSGGADSSAVACLIWLMYQRTYGKDYYKGEYALRDHFTCAYQATKNSSKTTEKAAREVANYFGANYIKLDVDNIVEQYKSKVSKSLKRKLSWEKDDIALQNIQARVRSPSIWMIANLTNSILISTSNRSEAAVGYCTMDGDTSGGLSPIAGIDKAFLLEWLWWAKDKYKLKCLTYVLDQKPTAELKPKSQDQTDEKDLMPYPILDKIEKLAIRDKKSPMEVFKSLSDLDYSKEQVGQWVEKFFNLWCRNQWKRERYAPSFHLDDENLDPKTWCRFPILSSGYRLELDAMWDYIRTGK